jgi:glycosyltransferase involved in cell wall biosynthesis
MVSAFVRTLDEEANLPSCLRSLAWSDDVVVVDSGSTDRTRDVARESGARVVTRPLRDEAEHLNWIGANVAFRHPWVYCADADEIVTEELAREILATTADGSRPEVAYRVRFKTMFLGKWVRHASLYPTWALRLFRPGRVRWERSVNTTCVVDGAEGRLQEHFLHHSFSKGLHAWFEKHNRYSTLEAREALAAIRAPRPALGLLLSSDAATRRRALKALSFRLPARPLLRFAYSYLARGGVLDGMAGLRYCQLLATYERMIDLKVLEIRRREAGLSL